ncbi:MAG: ornithine cyclodeaminase family protein [Hamadaea sp.]|nr:ornithine cyclodeaminase family protein [Hamadaea sp.]
MPWLDPAALSAATAADVLADALLAGLDPEAGPPRTSAPAPGGELLLMPAAHGRYAGVKTVSVAPGNPARGLPRIHGVYLLFDGETLVPVALVDGAGLTVLRTPAVSLVGVARLTPDRPLRTVVFGTGPQASAHLRGVADLRPGSEFTVVGRDAAKSAAFAARCGDLPVAAAVADADIVICATTAETPLFDGTAVPDAACVVAVGSHQPQVREVDEAFVARAGLFVESRGAATREAGELVGVDPARLVNLAELLSGARVDLDRPRFFKTVGMAWEDLVVAGALHTHL